MTDEPTTDPPLDEPTQAEPPGGDLAMSEPTAAGPSAPLPERRPMLERIGLAAIALVFASLFGIVAAAATAGGELFLGVLGAVGCLMTLWVGFQTLIRG